MRNLRIFGCASFLVLVLVSSALADGSEELQDCGGGVRHKKTIELDSTVLPLLGCSLFRYWGFAVYTAALYGPKSWSSSNEFQLDSAGKLVLNYHYEISAKDIAKSANEFLAKQNKTIPADVLLAVERLHRAYEDVSPGDSYALEYLPGKGTRLLRNNSLVIEIPGEAFASYYYRIWLDNEEPINERLRESLLGKS